MLMFMVLIVGDGAKLSAGLTYTVHCKKDVCRNPILTGRIEDWEIIFMSYFN